MWITATTSSELSFTVDPLHWAYRIYVSWIEAAVRTSCTNFEFIGNARATFIHDSTPQAEKLVFE